MINQINNSLLFFHWYNIDGYTHYNMIIIIWSVCVLLRLVILLHFNSHECQDNHACNKIYSFLSTYKQHIWINVSIFYWLMSEDYSWMSHFHIRIFYVKKKYWKGWKKREREGEGSIRRLTLLNIHFKNKKILFGGKKTLARLRRYCDRTLPDVDLLGKFYAPTEKRKKGKWRSQS